LIPGSKCSTYNAIQVYAIKNFAKDLFPVADQFILALDHVEKMSEEDLNSNQELKDLANGVKMTQGELNKAFDKNKIKLSEFFFEFHQVNRF